MNCCNDTFTACNDIFNRKIANRDLKRFIKKGPSRSTKKLINFLLEDLDGRNSDKTLLDIGSGIAAIGLTVNIRNRVNVTCVDVSTEYLNTARNEVIKRGLNDRFRFLNNDILDISEDLPSADIVTLDKAICCYDDYLNLVKKSVKKSRWIYGIILPRDTWWVKIMNTIGNLFRKIAGKGLRTFVHPVDHIVQIVKSYGFKKVYTSSVSGWSILVFKHSTS